MGWGLKNELCICTQVLHCQNVCMNSGQKPAGWKIDCWGGIAHRKNKQKNISQAIRVSASVFVGGKCSSKRAVALIGEK